MIRKKKLGKEKSGKVAKVEFLKAKNHKVAVVVSKFNQDVTDAMLQGALETLKQAGVQEKNIRVVWVPGAFEIPLALQKLGEDGLFDGLVALGCVIKGKSDHYYYINNEVSRGVMKVMLDYSLPIGFGVLTVKNVRQAKERAKGKQNKGIEAAEAMLLMLEQF